MSLLVLFTTGCVIVRMRVASVLRIRAAAKPNRSVSIGFSEAVWAPSESGPILIARGWHPREHETYCFFINEPNYGVGDPRWLSLTPIQGTDNHTLHIWTRNPPLLGDNPPWQRSHFTCTLNISYKKAGRAFRLRLKNQKLHSPTGENITVSGTVIAKPVSYKIIEQKIRNREKEIQKFSLHENL